MAHKYQIKQQVKTINKKWLEPVYESQIYRIANMEYKRMVNDNPGEYFELVFVNIIEECIKFTPT